MSDGSDSPRTLSAAIPAIPIPTPTGAPATRSEDEAKARIATLEREARALGTDPRAALLFHEIGRLWEQPLKHARHAAVAYQSAFKLAPGFVANVRAARRLFSEVGNWVMVVQLLDAELAALADRPGRAALLHEKAQVLEQRLSRDTDAVATWAQCLALEPTELSLLSALETVFTEKEDFASLVKVQRAIAAAATEPQTKAQYLTSAGMLLEDRLKLAGDAAACFREAFALERRDPLLLSAVKRLAQKEGAVDEELTVLAAEAELQGEQAAPTYLQISKAYERLGRGEDALAALVAARKVAPKDPLVLSELARIYESQQKFDELADVLGAWAQALPDEAERLALHLRLAQLQEEKLKKEHDAIATYRLVVERSPGHAAALSSLGKLYHRSANWAGLVETYEAEARSIDDPRQRAARLYKAAEVLEERLQKAEDAIARYQAALQAAPGYLPAQKALSRLFERLGRWAELIETFEQDLLQLSDREQQIGTLTRIAAVYEERLHDAPHAIETLRRVLELASDHVPTLRNLARLFERENRWKELLELHDQEAGLSGDTRHIVSLIHRNAEILEEQLKDRLGATQAWERVLQLTPNYPPALKALGRLYAQDGKWDELVRMYRAEADIAPTAEQSAQLIFKAGELLEQRLKSDNEAIAAYQEVLTLAPQYVPAVRALARIHRAQQAWEPLIEILRAEAANRTDPLERANAMFQAAAIWEDQLARPEKAIEGYQEVLRLSPNHSTAQQQIERLLTARDDVKELVVLFDRQAQSPAAPVRAAANLKLARLYLDRLNEPARAAQCAEAALAADPQSLSALKLLERVRATDRARRGEVRQRLAERVTDAKLRSALKVMPSGRDELTATDVGALKAAAAESPADETLALLLERALGKSDDTLGLVDLYERRRQLALPSADRAAVLLRLGELYEERLGSVGPAATAYEEALELFPGLAPAALGLARTFAAMGNPARALPVLETLANQSKDPGTANDALVAAGDIAAKADQFDKATAYYKRVLDHSPLHPTAGPALEELLASRGGSADVAALHERRAELRLTQGDTAQAADGFHAAAQVYRDQVKDAAKTRDALAKALAAKPTHVPSLELQAELAIEAQSWAEAVALLSVRIEQGGDPSQVARTHFKLGALHHDQFSDLGKAASHLTAGLVALPTDAEALERLASIHQVSQNWQGAAQALDTLLGVVTEPTAKAKHSVALAELKEQRFDDATAAATLYRQALDLTPSDGAVLDKLVALYDRLGNQVELVHLLEKQAQAAQAAGQSDRAATLRLRIGHLYAGSLNLTERAIATWRSILDGDPQHVGALESLARAYAKDPAQAAMAIETHRALLRLEPSRLESWHALFKLWESIRAVDKAFCAAGVLTFFKAATEAQAAFYAEAKGRLPSELSVTFTDAELLVLHHPLARSPLIDVMKAVGDQLSKPYPPQFDVWGVDRKADKLKPDHAVFKAVRTVTQVLTQEELEVFTAKRGLVHVEATEPMAVLVGPDAVRKFNLREQRFLFARAGVLLADKAALLKRFSVAEAADWLGNSVRIHKPQFQGLGKPSEEASKQLRKWYSRKALKQLEEPADAVAQGGPHDAAALVDGIGYSADRAGLTFAGDVAAGLAMLLREELSPGQPKADTTEALTKAVGERKELRELVLYAVSDDLFRLRQRLGFSLG